MQNLDRVNILIEREAEVQFPQFLTDFVNERLRNKLFGGRPHFIQQLAKDHNVTEELLNILELAWIKNKPIRSIAKQYNISYYTIYRLLQELEPMKRPLSEYLTRVPRRKKWYMPELDSSDYETVQGYIKRARRDGLKTYKQIIKYARRCWTALNYKDPSNWESDEVCDFLSTLKPVAQSAMLDCIRQVAPQLRDQIKTGRFREKIARRKKDLFGNEINLIHAALKEEPYLKTVFDFHISTGLREGSRDPRSGLVGISWDRFKNDFRRVDLYESKVRGGITWRDCPTDLFFDDLPVRLKNLWIERGKPTNERFILHGYKELKAIYKTIREILKAYFDGKIEPSLLKELTTLQPHDADKIHCNLLWEAEVPLEVVAGQYLGQGEGIGLMGRGWLDINTIKKHYLSLTARSDRFKELEQQVRDYSGRFKTYSSRKQREGGDRCG
jgi:hypothetical protein